MATEPYFFTGVVYPERAQLSLQVGLKFSHFASGYDASAKVSVVLNQVAVWVDSEHEWDIYDLRNVVKNIVQAELSLVGYVKGYAYDFEITRVVCRSRDIDFVYGIDIACLANRGASSQLETAIPILRGKMTGSAGVFIARCLADLSSAIKHADDTAFYCYRAIESLRHHCTANHSIDTENKSAQWEKFRAISGISQGAILEIKNAADPLRHGNPIGGQAIDRTRLLTSTWGIVDAYLERV